MRAPNLESLIEESEKLSPDYVDDETRQKLINEAEWMDWAEKQLEQAQEHQGRLFQPKAPFEPIDLIPCTTPPVTAGVVNWKIATGSSANGGWSVPVTMTAPPISTQHLILPKIGWMG